MVHASVSAKFPSSTPTDADLGIYTNALGTTLTSAVTNSTTTFAVSSTTGWLANMYAGLYGPNGYEVVRVVSVDSATQLTVARAQDGTGATPGSVGYAHVSSQKLIAVIPALGLNQMRVEIQAISGAYGNITTAQYLTLATNASLTNERVFTPGAGLTATDGGAGSTYGLVVDQSAGFSPTWLGSHTFSHTDGVKTNKVTPPGGTLTVAGNLTITGTTTTVQSTNLVITDNIVLLNNGEGGAGVTLGTSGLQIDRGSLSDARLVFDESTDSFNVSYDDGATLVQLIEQTRAQALTNKTIGNTNIVTLRDDRFTLQDNSDNTKQLVFELSGISTGTTRTLTLQDSSGTVALTSNKLSAFAATTSAELAGVISDETGSGSLVFASSPTLTSPTINGTVSTTGLTMPAFTGGTITFSADSDALKWSDVQIKRTSASAAGPRNSTDTAFVDWVVANLEVFTTVRARSGTSPTIQARNTSDVATTVATLNRAATPTLDISAGRLTAAPVALGGAIGFASTFLQYHNGTTVLDVASLTGTETLTNKTIGISNVITLTDLNFTLQDDGDTTKQMKFQLSGITTGQTRTITAPNASGTMALLQNHLGEFAATTSAQLAGIISDETGSGALVFGTAPTLANPIIGNISPSGNFTLTQNSVAVVTSVSTGAIANTLYLDAGRVGFGTSAPGARLHVESANVAANSNTNGFVNFFTTDAFAADIGGGISFGGKIDAVPNYRVFGAIFGRKANGTSGNQEGYLSFVTNGPSDMAERMRITSDGNVGIGATPLSYQGVLLANTVTATASGTARGTTIGHTLTADANNRVLTALFQSTTYATGTFTGLDAIGINIDGAGWVKTGTGTIANAYGLYITAPTIGTTNYALYVASGSTYLGGLVGIGTVPTQSRYAVVIDSGSTVATSGEANGVRQLQTLTASANGDVLTGYYHQNTVAKGAFTGLTWRGFHIKAPGVNGTGTIDNAHALYIEAPTIGTNNYALYVGGKTAFAGATGAASALHIGGGTSTTGVHLYSDTVGKLWLRNDSGNQGLVIDAHAAAAVPYVEFQQNGTVVGNIQITNGAGMDFYKDSTNVGLRLKAGEPASGETVAELRYHNGTSVVRQLVTVGAADSGGAGYKVLRVPN